ncbi:hypothetical protein ACJX0J_015340 [Zea mays]
MDVFSLLFTGMEHSDDGDLDDEKELAELDAKKGTNQIGDAEKKEDAPAPPESKASKKKKKKDKSSKEGKETQEALDGSEETASAGPDEDTSAVDSLQPAARAVNGHKFDIPFYRIYDWEAFTAYKFKPFLLWNNNIITYL